MSYLSADLIAPTADNIRQPVDISNDDWAATMYAASRRGADLQQASRPWLSRQPPKLRQQRAALA
ncbi:hypothetical protein LA66_00865 [Aureimonas altamirensis]|uniref:Uncharacterized protein n=1 Tax=Aureimonas altamirensis TaxID=370622 RepID=A0A0B1Q8J7_9HYPH|nr:hypothetical protein [Aureimonas altamirensis]KHJ55267.1 hypothetical protein LA66_00865 [Aureimonas altamirensis]